MSKRTVMSFIYMGICGVFLMTSCATPPTQEMDAAESAINDVRNAEAEIYANDHFQKVVNEFQSAQKYMAAKDFGPAREAALKTIELAKTTGQEIGIQKQLMKADAEEKLSEFLGMWGAMSKNMEKGRGRAARALAKEAGMFSEEISGQLNELKNGEKWSELLAAIESANMKAEEFKGKMK